ncbi:cell division protein FtsL [Lutimaribacter sp. EGI FJ00015]|uniref:Cell division protein FtsL n=1 Tax=Lutimaribacter degradans TaxID=2945989 RepID=A0ACC5ZRV1_9RHOB|nr:cell division protein FtsL [Lutimaribacter sp. EGI FJ00013]MCM2560673.1 cell division protein FtsL [Lutimaribacter sp. EGI FJ00013]MCO0612383.1 cell division protein FtsL [Lutimaribacter sp. EGI FJ00015]MCO0634497.1 cell division protein FtsL [Lutimaribacter sp. EGI FJ00014]
MRSILSILTACAVIGLAFWAYHENYKTQEALAKSEQLQRDIASARARLSVLRAEWAYLNRPDRLRELATLNFDKLGLLPFAPEQFGRVDKVPYPPQGQMLPVTQPVDVSSAMNATEASE